MERTVADGEKQDAALSNSIQPLFTEPERQYGRIVRLCGTALTGNIYAPASQAWYAHRAVLSLLPQGIYRSGDEEQREVMGIMPNFTVRGDERYFVFYYSSSGTLKRRLLVGSEHGEKSGWFNYLADPKVPCFRLIAEK